MKKEPLKSLAIILLFVSAAILGGEKFDFFNAVKQEKDYQISSINTKEVIQEVVLPSRIIVNLGNNGKTVLYNQNPSYYQEAAKVLVEAVENNDTLVESDLVKYNQQKEIKSVEIKFDNPVDSRLLTRSLFLDKSLIAETGKIKEILIPLVDDNSVYLKTMDKIFRLPLSQRVTMTSIDALTSSSPPKFYTLNELYDSTSMAMTELEGGINQVPYVTTSRATSIEEKDQIAKYIFGEKYDFISKITEIDESTTYTYNFGQEYLKIKSSGSIEYINENSGADRDSSWDKSIEAALNFLNTLDFDMTTLKLEGMDQTLINGKRGYRINFVWEIDGFEVHPSIPNQKIIIELIGNKVYSFKGINRQVSRPIPITSQAITPMDVISKNYEMLRVGFGFQTGNQLIDLILDIKQVYKLDSQYQLRPCYKIDIGTRKFYFDIYTGEEVRNGLV